MQILQSCVQPDTTHTEKKSSKLPKVLFSIWKKNIIWPSWSLGLLIPTVTIANTQPCDTDADLLSPILIKEHLRKNDHLSTVSITTLY